ncbi:hypothetical protein [Chamaesiphon polymorphus]|nr:hypothetical protein [Chamaesiphon polymorphus]
MSAVLLYAASLDRVIEGVAGFKYEKLEMEAGSGERGKEIQK